MAYPQQDGPASEMPEEMVEADDGMGGGALPPAGGAMDQADGWAGDSPLPGEPTGSIDPGVTEAQGSAPITNALDC